MSMLNIEAREALHTLLGVEKEIADIYWVHGGKSALDDEDLERWAGTIHQAYEVLRDIVDNHLVIEA